MMNTSWKCLFGCLLLAGCEMIDVHPYDVRISGGTDINAKNITRIEEMCKGKDVIRFAVTGDTQRWYDETEDFVKALNERNDIDFLVHCGDFSDFGLTDEFLWQRDILSGLNIPYVALIGNHDVIGTGEETFRAVFGETNFSFIAGGVKFVCLNTNALDYDYSEPIPDFAFMEDQLVDRSDEFQKTFICMHARPFSEVFNNNVAKPFEYYVNRYPGLQCCLVAHDHHLADEDLFGDGVHYITCESIQFRNYLLFTVTADANYEYEQVFF